MDKQREEFEKWLEETHGLYGEDVEWQQGRNCYAKFGIHLAFKAWQASRASIVVELPDPKEDRARECSSDDIAYGFNQGVGKCKDVIRSIGLSIKGE